ncbi:ras guanine nucleotide exchange factor domain-containing protein [Limtongia smithiae]|uniref:ras guanine nucleotide exchange factor domain-containing protein n=1 Tax=Limtongia smithiae TaxID=1125753 RepID=UPI0034CE105B
MEHSPPAARAPTYASWPGRVHERERERDRQRGRDYSDLEPDPLVAGRQGAHPHHDAVRVTRVTQSPATQTTTSSPSPSVFLSRVHTPHTPGSLGPVLYDADAPFTLPLLRSSPSMMSLPAPQFSSPSTVLDQIPEAPSAAATPMVPSAPDFSPRPSTPRDLAEMPIEYDTNGHISGITPERLVIMLTSPDALDYEFLSDVFLAYRQFITPMQLLKLLSTRFQWAVNRVDDTGRTVRLRTFVVLRHWVLNYFPHDFVPSLPLRIAFVSVLNDFSSYGKVRSSTGDRRLLGELKRCWIRNSCLYWDFPPLTYDTNGARMTAMSCFGFVLQSGGHPGSRDPTVRQPHELPEPAPLVSATNSHQHHSVSSPILPRSLPTNVRPASAASFVSSSVTSLSSNGASAASIDELADHPYTPPVILPQAEKNWHKLHWGALIRGEAMASIPNDEQARVTFIVPSSPNFSDDELNDGPDARPSEANVQLHNQEDIRTLMSSLKRIFKSQQPALPSASADAPTQRIRPRTSISSVSSLNHVPGAEDVGIRIDVLAASVIENYKQLTRTSLMSSATASQSSLTGSLEPSIAIPEEEEAELGPPPRLSYTPVRSSVHSAMYQAAISREHLHRVATQTPRTVHNEVSDIESMRGQESPGNNEHSSSPEDLSSPPGNHFSAARVIWPVSSNGNSDMMNTLQSTPEHESSARTHSDVGSGSPRMRRGLRRRGGQNIGEYSRMHSGTPHSGTSSSATSMLSGGEVTSFRLPRLGSQFDFLGSSTLPHSSSSSMSRSSHRRFSIRGNDLGSSSVTGHSDGSAAYIGIPGISNDIMARELSKLAAIPYEDSDSAKNEDAVSRALRKLEGDGPKAPPTPAKVSTAFTATSAASSAVPSVQDTSDDDIRTPSRLHGAVERNAWFVEGIVAPSSVPMQTDRLVLTTPTRTGIDVSANTATSSPLARRGARNRFSSSSSLEERQSMLSTESSMISLSIHLPFVLKYRARKLAEQFTLIERDALAEIDWLELISLRWHQNVKPVQDWLEFVSSQSSDAPAAAPGIVNDEGRKRGVELLFTRFNLMTSWVTSEILLTRNLAERVRVLVKFIHIAVHAHALQNYSTMMQVTLALASPTVQRLESTWAGVAPEDMRAFKTLEDVASPMRNFKKLRAEMDRVDENKGCIPFIGLYLSDLTFNAQRDAYSKTHPAMVNLDRFVSAARIIKNLLHLVQTARVYDSAGLATATSDDEADLMSRCLYISCLDDEEIDECFGLLDDP